MPKIKAIVFDMDGVLIDAREWHYEALNEALRLFGAEIPRDMHLLEFDGLPTALKLERLSKKTGWPDGLSDVVSELKQRKTLEKAVSNCYPRFAHQFLLKHLKDQGFRVGMASNSIKDTVKIMTKLAGISDYFDSILSSCDVSEPKPAPEIYLKSFELLDVSPNEVLVVEDNENGINAARSSGAFCMEVKSPDDVTYRSVMEVIKSIEDGAAA